MVDEDWEVVCVAPRRYKADYGYADFSALPGEPCGLVDVRAIASRSPHLFAYGGALHAVMREHWDAVHVWEEPYIVAGAQVAAWAPRKAALAFFTFQNIRKRYPPPFSWFERYTLERADGWLYSGQSVLEAQRGARGYRDRPAALGPLGVDTGIFRPDADARRRIRQTLGWRDDGPVVLGFVGRFVPEKGLRFLMRAIDELKQPVRVLFLGSGPLEPELRAWAKQRDDGVRITVAPHDRVADYVNAMDVLCAPSETARHWREQFGRMIIEAFACAVPVVGSDSGEIPYVIGDAGCVEREGDLVGWVRTLATLVDDAGRRRELGERGLARAHDVYAWPVVARQHLGFLAELAERRRASA